MAGALVLLLAGPAPARAEAPEVCDPGPVRAMFEAFMPGVDQYFFLNPDIGISKTLRCQYRLFWTAPDQHFCFSEDDYFLGGITFLAPEGPDAFPIGLIRDVYGSIDVTVELVTFEGDDDVDPQDLDVEKTTIHQGYRVDLGNVAYQQHGVFLHLKPGHYATRTWTYTPYDAADPPYDGCDTLGNCYVGQSDVIVVDRAQAAKLGPSSGFGNVQCPAP